MSGDGTVWLWVYITGCAAAAVSSFLEMRRLNRRGKTNLGTPRMAFLSLTMALVSWIGVVFVALDFLVEYMEDRYK